jgi:hypothetical protein
VERSRAEPRLSPYGVPQDAPPTDTPHVVVRWIVWLGVLTVITGRDAHAASAAGQGTRRARVPHRRPRRKRGGRPGAGRRARGTRVHSVQLPVPDAVLHVHHRRPARLAGARRVSHHRGRRRAAAQPRAGARRDCPPAGDRGGATRCVRLRDAQRRPRRRRPARHRRSDSLDYRRGLLRGARPARDAAAADAADPRGTML